MLIFAPQIAKEASPGPTRAKTSTRRQAVMSIDMDTWRDIIETFNIREPMIPHREEESTQGPGARSWYS